MCIGFAPYTTNYDMNQKILTKKVISKISVELTSVHDYVHWHCSIDYLIFNNENLCENCFHFTLKRFLLNSFGEMCFSEESYKKDVKILILKFLRVQSI